MNPSLVYLVQTDTTVGFLSSNDKRLADIKHRNYNQKILQVVDSFQELCNNVRIPSNRKNMIRKSNHTTFIYPKGLSFRVVSGELEHNRFIRKFSSLFSTSANKTKHDFDKTYAISKVDIVLYTADGFSQSEASSIFKINNKKIIKLR